MSFLDVNLIDFSVPTYSIFPKTNEVFIKDRSLSGRGVFVAGKNDLTALEECRLTVEKGEIIWASLQFAKS